jgi:hypothetical protein
MRRSTTFKALREAQSITQHAKQPIVATAEENITVAGFVAPVGCSALISGQKDSGRWGTAHRKQRTVSCSGCNNYQTITQTGIDMLASTGPTPSNQSGHDGI